MQHYQRPRRSALILCVVICVMYLVGIFRNPSS